MPEVWYNETGKAIRFSRYICLDEFILYWFCKQFKSRDEAKQIVDLLKEVLYLYRTQGNLSALIGLIGASSITELQQIVNLMNQYEDLGLTIMNQAITSLRSGVVSLLRQLGPWKDITKWEGYLNCPGLQTLFVPINEIFATLADSVEFLQFKYNFAKRFLQEIGQKNIINTKFLDAAIDILDYLSDRINVLCAPFR